LPPHRRPQLRQPHKPTPHAPAKTKEELREMLAQAVRNAQPETENKPLHKAKKSRRSRDRPWRAAIVGTVDHDAVNTAVAPKQWDPEHPRPTPGQKFARIAHTGS
jgi:hypothetical protein